MFVLNEWSVNNFVGGWAVEIVVCGDGKDDIRIGCGEDAF